MSDQSKKRAGKEEARASAAEIARLKAELAQERAKSLRYRLAAESATNLIYEWDLSSRLEWLGRVDELLCCQPDEIPRTWEGYTSLLHPADRDRVLAAIEKQLKSEEPYSVECRVRRKDGTFLYWQDRGAVVRDESGKPVKWIGAVTDITERKRTEAALAVSEEKFRKAFYTNPDAVSLNRLADGLYVSINTGFTKIMGYAEGDIVGRTSIELNIWDDPDDRRRLVADLQEHGVVENLEARFRAKSGALKDGLVSAALIEIEGRPHLLGIVRDITERKQAEKLQEIIFRIASVANSAVSLDELFRSIHDSIGALLPADNFYIALYDADKDEISFPYFVDPYDEPPLPSKPGRGLTEYVLRTGAPLLAPPEVFESLVRRGDVELIGENSVDWLGVPLRVGERTIGVMVVQSYAETVRFGRRELEFLSFVSSQVAMAIVRKQAEEGIRVSLQEKEVLLREIHHRVKNNLQVISSLFNLQVGHSPDDACRGVFKEAQTRIRSMSLVHEKLFQSGNLSRIDFGGYINSLALHLVQAYSAQPGCVRLETEFEDVTLDIASAMPCGLLLNELISNAIKHAFPESRAGVIRIGLKRRPGGLIEVRVADDGIGFPKDLDFRKANSFGLQIVNLLAGQLEAAIELDRTNGTAFTVTFRELKYSSRT